jgi:hypothetical protein
VSLTLAHSARKRGPPLRNSLSESRQRKLAGLFTPAYKHCAHSLSESLQRKLAGLLTPAYKYHVHSPLRMSPTSIAPTPSPNQMGAV